MALVMLVACSSPQPASTETTEPPGSPGVEVGPDAPRPVGSLSIVSVVGAASGASGSSWTLPSDERSFDVRISIQGTGTVTVDVRLLRDGREIHNDTQVHQLDGDRIDLTFPEVGNFDEPGEYTLVVEASGPGARQRSEVSVRRR